MTQLLSKLDRYRLFGLVIKAITGVIGGSLVLEQNHPYITLTVLAIGAAANEAVNILQAKSVKNED